MIQLLLSFLFVLISFQSNSDLVGKWYLEDENGAKVYIVEFKTNLTYEVDLGANNDIDVIGKYSLQADKMTVQDTGGPEACDIAQKGIYQLKINANQLTVTKIQDECPGRGGDVETVVMKKLL